MRAKGDNIHHSGNKTSFEISATKKKIAIKQSLNCKTRGLLYVIECHKCHSRPQYVGKTTRSLTLRGREHMYNIEKLKTDGKRRSTSKMYAHFSSNGHSTRDLHIYGIEQVFGDGFTLQARERYWINRMDSVRKGLNTYRT